MHSSRNAVNANKSACRLERFLCWIGHKDVTHPWHPEGGWRMAEVGNAYPLAAFSQVKLVKLGTKAVLISKLKRL